VSPGQGDIERQPVTEVEIGSLSVAGSPRAAAQDAEHVAVLAAAPGPLPPIVVHRATMRVIDGRHRVTVARLAGRRTIAARFFDGTDADAFVLAVRLNTAHGLPLTLAERKAAAGRILGSHPQWSDRMIAATAGLAPGTIASLRKKTTLAADAGDARVGQDGRARPVSGTGGRQLASELIAENPSLSLRAVARAAGISPETVRDVRNRLSRGESPIPQPGSRGPDNATVRLAERREEAGPPAPLHAGRHRDASAIVERLMRDPALRFSETGRSLLRMLSIHLVSAQEWDHIIANLPPHCRGLLAQLGRECAETWVDFADRAECEPSNKTG
jgi:ParB-like chromosome segregation protein Spo0J